MPTALGGEFREGIPDEMAREEVLELDQERTGEVETREKETAGKRKKNPQENAVKGLADAFQTSTSSLTRLKTWTQHGKVFITRGRSMASYLLTSKFDEIREKPSKPP